MPNRQIIQVFLGSPGDLKEERQAAKNAVDTFNRQWADFFGTQVELVGWEDTVSRSGRPQEIINLELDRCEAFIGIMWKRWGTPPDREGRYTSGFEEEFERAAANQKKAGRPEISLFFKEIDAELLKDPGSDLKKVVAFKEKIVGEKQILFETFATPTEFQERISNCITRYVQQIKKDEAAQNSEEAKSTSFDDLPPEPEQVTAEKAYNPLSSEGSQFLRDFVAKAARGDKANLISATEVARFRLLSYMVSTPANDEAPIGTHDANLLFDQRDSIRFSRQEQQALIECGLESIADETVPFWHWYAQAEFEGARDLTVSTIIGPQAQRAGALTAMRLIGSPIKPLPPITEGDDTGISRQRYVELWLAASTNEKVKVAALEYLSVYGEIADLPLLQAEYDRQNYQTKGASIDAILRVSLRHSRERAIQALMEVQPESVDSELMNLLFSKPAVLRTELLLKGVSHRSSQVRSAVVPILAERRALGADLALRLLDDSEAKIRFEALSTLIGDGREFSDEKVKAILVKPGPRASGLGGLFGGYGGYPMPDNAGEEQWKRYQKVKLLATPDAALEKLNAVGTIIDQSARFALDRKHFSERSAALRASVDDEFRGEFDAAVEQFQRRFGDTETVAKVKSLDQGLRKELTRSAVDLLAEMQRPEDLPRMREAIARGFIEFATCDVEYLGRHGEWADLNLLVSLLDRRESGSVGMLWAMHESSRLQPIAEAVYSIAKGRFSEVCELVMPAQLQSNVIALGKDAEIRSLPDEQIIRLLSSEDHDVRRALLLRLIKAVPKKRLKQLLAQYAEGSKRYYNVNYWLDLGTSLSKQRVLCAVAQMQRKNR